MRILVVALNPSIDAEWRVDNVRWEEKNSILAERRWAGGKGVNVARWLKYLGAQPRLILPLGGSPGDELARGLRAERLPARIVPLRQPTRVNIVVTTRAARQLRFNPAGPRLSLPEWHAIVRAVESELPKAQLLILSGSLPQGVPVTAYAQLIRRAHRAGVRSLLDCDGQALLTAVRARPFLIKPNEHELAQWIGRSLRSEDDVLRAARRLSTSSGGWVLVSRGARRAVLVNAQTRSLWFSRPPRAQVRNTVGAGDALVAAAAQAILQNALPAQWLRSAVATGTAATQSEAGALVPRALLNEFLRAVTISTGRSARARD